MDPNSPRWKEITPSEFPWEREALAFVRERLPDYEPYRAWSNFEFIADNGSVNEVDLLVLSPKGFFLVEIKSKPGQVSGDQGTWTWLDEGRVTTVDNPLLLANRKAKKLISLLRRQKALLRGRSPFLEARVFLSAKGLDCRLDEHLLSQVHLRDRPATPERPERPGIVAALTTLDPGSAPRFRIDRPMAKAVTRAMEEAGIRPSQKARKAGDYILEELLLEGPSYQDWSARHQALERERARIRIYGLGAAVSEEDRLAVRRAAKREYEILRGVQHEGILAAKGYTEHVRGPALIFEHHPNSQRLDHYLAERAARLDIDQRLHLLREIAEALGYAHEQRLVHRALAPQSVLVVDPESRFPRLQIYNWQTGSRSPAGTRTSEIGITATSHVEDLVEDAVWIYLAPEVVTDRGSGSETSDVFSLGAIAYHIFSGRPPAASLRDLHEMLREGKGLQISAGSRRGLDCAPGSHPVRNASRGDGPPGHGR